MSPRTKNQLDQIRHRTRQKILAAALELFALHGYHGTSISQIAKKAGISKGLAYNYFESKSRLLQAVVMQGMEMIDSMLAGSAEIDNPQNLLVVIIERYFAMMDQNEHFWRLFSGLMLQESIFKETRSIIMKYYDGFYSFLENLMTRIGVEDPHTEAKILGALFDGVGLNYLFDRDNYPVEKVKNFLIKRYMG